MGTADFFGHVASTKERRGMFSVFYDMSPSEIGFGNNNLKNQSYILVTTVCGDALKIYQRMSNSQIVELCVGTLKLMFPEEHVPSPTGYAISRWGADPYAQMSYSYVALGSSGEDYDVLSEDVGGRILFAGEVRHVELTWQLWQCHHIELSCPLIDLLVFNVIIIIIIGSKYST